MGSLCLNLHGSAAVSRYQLAHSTLAIALSCFGGLHDVGDGGEVSARYQREDLPEGGPTMVVDHREVQKAAPCVLTVRLAVDAGFQFSEFTFRFQALSRVFVWPSLLTASR